MSDLETVVIDWETYWCTKSRYSLKVRSYTEYVRDKRFRAHGFAIARGSEGFKARWVTHDDVPATLAAIDWSKTRLVGHNGLFDFLVAAERYGVLPAQYFCTMAAARFWHQGEVDVGLDKLAKYHRLHGKLEGLDATNGVFILPPELESTLATYAIRDVTIGAILYGKYCDRLTEDERRLMDLTFRMFCDPLLEVDLELVREGFKDALRTRIAKIDATDVPTEILRSRDKFAQALVDLGVDPPTKISKTTGKRTWAFSKTDEEFIELLDHEDIRVRNLVEAQMASKSTIALTRALRLFRIGRTGKLAVAYHYARAKTHRFSGANNMNLQNFVRGSKLRAAIRAPAGYVMCVADSSNIESRGSAWLAGQEDKLELFRRGEDPYNAMASSIYARPIDRKRKAIDENGNEYKPDFIEGFVGKTAELGLGYGMGPPKFKITCKRGMGGVSVDLDLGFCSQVVDTWRRKHYRIVELWGMLDGWATMLAQGTGEPVTYRGLTLAPRERRIWLPNGTSMHYADCQFDDEGKVIYRDGRVWKTLYGGKLMENLIQKLSRDVIADQMLRINERYRVVMMTHDEIIWLALEHEAEAALAFGVAVMKTPPAWAAGWPLDAEGGYARNYVK